MLNAPPLHKTTEIRTGRQRHDSWTSLIAATTVGLESLGCVTVGVRLAWPGDNFSSDEHVRLIVQSYRQEDLVDGLPSRYARPRGSSQREVTRRQLLAGVQMSLVSVGDNADDVSGTVVVAWLEVGRADLEFDGLRSRPDRALCLAHQAVGASSRVSVVFGAERAVAA